MEYGSLSSSHFKVISQKIYGASHFCHLGTTPAPWQDLYPKWRVGKCLASWSCVECGGLIRVIRPPIIGFCCYFGNFSKTMFLFLLSVTHQSGKHSCLSPFVSITRENTVQRHARGLAVSRHIPFIMKNWACVCIHIKDSYEPSEVFSKKLSRFKCVFACGSHLVCSWCFHYY